MLIEKLKLCLFDWQRARRDCSISRLIFSPISLNFHSLAEHQNKIKAKRNNFVNEIKCNCLCNESNENAIVNQHVFVELRNVGKVVNLINVACERKIYELEHEYANSSIWCIMRRMLRWKICWSCEYMQTDVEEVHHRKRSFRKSKWSWAPFRSMLNKLFLKI